MEHYETDQHAYAGYYATRDETGRLIAGRPGYARSGGACTVVHRPRLYETAEAAEEAAAAMGTVAVMLVAEANRGGE